jgi:glycosyltransferase involved in cell wall biosynthesis
MSRISVVIPHRNSGALLRKCLAALRASESANGPLHEIVVVDDASTDDSAAVASDFGAKLYTLETNVGPARARNYGAEQATGDFLWFLDADVEVTPSAVGVVARHFDGHPECKAAIGSYDDDPSEKNTCSQFKNLFHHFVHQEAGATVSSFWTGCGVMRRDVFGEIGGFDANYWTRPSVEDIHLGYLLGRHGHKIHMLKQLQVKHNKRWTFINLIRTDVFQRAVPWTAMLLHNRGRGNSELNLGWPARASVISVYLAVLAVLAGFLRPWVWATIPVWLSLPVILNWKLVAFFKRRGGWAFLLRAIPLLLIYFFYCGVGFVLGVGLYLREAWTGDHAFSERLPEQTPHK